MYGPVVLCLLLAAAFLPGSSGHCPETSCPNHPHPHYVCGTDGKTYSSECRLQKAICLASVLGKTVAKHYEGQCRGSQDHHGGGLPYHCQRRCPYGGPQVCGSDGNTYRNNCELLKASCINYSLSLLHEGPCANYGGHPGGIGTVIGGVIGGIIDGGHHCNRYKPCPQYGKQVCDNYGKVHRNLCELKKASCNNQRITLAPCRGGGVLYPPGGAYPHIPVAGSYPDGSHGIPHGTPHSAGGKDEVHRPTGDHSRTTLGLQEGKEEDSQLEESLEDSLEDD